MLVKNRQSEATHLYMALMLGVTCWGDPIGISPRFLALAN